MKSRILFSFFLLSTLIISAQDIPIGQWRVHAPYNNGIGVVEVGNDIYCLTSKSLFIYDKTTHEIIDRPSKLDGLSGNNFASIAYSETQNCVLIGYDDGVVDLLKGSDIINILDIKKSPISGNKKINSIFCKGKYAYLCCGLGVIVLNIEREEIMETYVLGENGEQIEVWSFTADDAQFYAATEKGIVSALQNDPWLSYYESWTSMPLPDTGRCSSIAFWKGKLFYYLTGQSNATTRLYMQTPGTEDYKAVIDYNTSVYNITISRDQMLVSGWTHLYLFTESYQNYQIIDAINGSELNPQQACYAGNGCYFIADSKLGLIELNDLDHFTGSAIQPNGPYSYRAFDLDTDGENMWVASGGHTTVWSASWFSDGMYRFDGSSWTSYNSMNKGFPEGIHDVTVVAINPYRKNQVYAGTWGCGLIEMTDDVVSNVFNSTNSPLTRRIQKPEQGEFVSGLAFDSKGVLWVVNSNVPNPMLSYNSKGEWNSYNLGIENSGVDLSGLIVDRYDNKWIVARSGYLIVFNENSDLQMRKIGSGSGTGNIDGYIYSVAQDNDGALWVGTNQGIYIIRDVSQVLNYSNGKMVAINAEHPKVTWNGYVSYLLETETVSSICVNGSNEKWCGTSKNGVFKISTNEDDAVFHFTVENTPLPSNEILDISITKKGEVFMASSEGVVSYRDESTKGTDENTNVYAFPNPVRPDYTGPIAVTGVVSMAHIKITDVAGNLVFSTQAQGGQAIWDAKDFNGKRVKTGVYLVFITDDEGDNTEITKIMVLN